MPSIQQTVDSVVNAPTLDARVTEIRKVPGQHGVDSHQQIYADIAREKYVPDLGADYAYIHEPDFFSHAHFKRSYTLAAQETADFTKVDQAHLAYVLQKHPYSLLTFRTITGLTKDEFAHATTMVAKHAGLAAGVSGSVVDGHERTGRAMKADRADLLARTITVIMDGSLFGQGPGAGVVAKPAFKPDTATGWSDTAFYAQNGVPYGTFLHQRHYGGSFRQVLDATSTERGNLLEDAVETLFTDHKVPFIRTGSHNQGNIYAQFGMTVAPAPDFAVYDIHTGALAAILECKGANDGGTARDKASRFKGLRAEGQRLGGIPVIAVLGGLGWKRVNDALGPVVRDCEGRVFTLTTLDDMLTVTPISGLVGTAP